MVLDYPQYPNGMYKLRKNDFDDIARDIMKEYMPGAVDMQQAVDINYLIKECLFLTVKSKNRVCQVKCVSFFTPLSAA